MSPNEPKPTEELGEALLERILDDLDVHGALEASLGLASSDGSPEQKAYWLGEVRTLAFTCLEDLDALTSAARELLAVALPTHAYEAATLAANAFICAGRYREALATEAWAQQRARNAPQADEGQAALLQINLAEADYNLGRWEHAARRLGALKEADLEGSSLLLGGLRCQRAWMGAARGEEGPVRLYLDTFDPDWLPRLFRAELYYCKAACHRVLGEREPAWEALREGEAASVRASSLRNGRFLRAYFLEQQGDFSQAADEYAGAANAAYRGQGGDALLAWGDLLATRMKRPDDAREAWEWVLARDPESAAAREAKERLRAQFR